MTPARRKSKVSFLIKIFLIICGFILTSSLFLKGEKWNGKDKLVLAINEPTGDVKVVVFDPTLSEITSVNVPGSTQVELSRNLGSWRIKSVWQLGINEKLGGKLLTETVTRNFKFPTTSWADWPADAFEKGEFLVLIKSLTVSYKTDLSFGDRFRLALFSMRVNGIKRSEVDLAETSVIKKSKLKDGETGYVLGARAPENLAAVFSDPKISDISPKVEIKDRTGKSYVGENLGEIIEVMGGKITAITKEKPQESDCEILGKNKEVVAKVATLFSCSRSKEAPSGNFDLEVRIGERFAKRF